VGETNISGAEWRVMEVIWERTTATAAEVVAALSPSIGWKHRTIRTLLARLVGKGALAARPDGNRYLYRPLVRRDRCVRQESQSFLRRVFRGDVGELLVHMVRDADISAAQIKELKRLLDEKRPRNE
jgi:BlaI family penicillinase repressor